MLRNPDKVMEFVESVLEANPDLDTSQVYQKAKRVDPGVGALSLRQFNARFPLQVKRRQALSRSGGRNGRRAKRGRGRREAQLARSRAAVRDAFLRFATELSAAEDPQDVVRVVAGVDTYVDEVIAAVK